MNRLKIKHHTNLIFLNFEILIPITCRQCDQLTYLAIFIILTRFFFSLPIVLTFTVRIPFFSIIQAEGISYQHAVSSAVTITNLSLYMILKSKSNALINNLSESQSTPYFTSISTHN